MRLGLLFWHGNIFSFMYLFSHESASVVYSLAYDVAVLVFLHKGSVFLVIEVAAFKSDAVGCLFYAFAVFHSVFEVSLELCSVGESHDSLSVHLSPSPLAVVDISIGAGELSSSVFLVFYPVAEPSGQV